MCQGSSYHHESLVMFCLKTFGGWLRVRDVFLLTSECSHLDDFPSEGKVPETDTEVGFHALMHPHLPRDLCFLENFLYTKSQCKAKWIIAITVTCAWIGVYLLRSYDVCQGYWKSDIADGEAFLSTDSCGLSCHTSFISYQIRKKKK